MCIVANSRRDVTTANDGNGGEYKDDPPVNMPPSVPTSDGPIVNASGNVAMPTKYSWDKQDLPSYWAPMDGSSVKTVVLHPTDSEYQLVADTFLTSLGNTLATVVQVC